MSRGSRNFPGDKRRMEIRLKVTWQDRRWHPEGQLLLQIWVAVLLNRAGVASLRVPASAGERGTNPLVQLQAEGLGIKAG